jgi:thiamine kinase-like enzyme
MSDIGSPLAPSPHVSLLDLHHKQTSEQRLAAERAAAAKEERAEANGVDHAHQSTAQHLLAVVSTALHSIVGSPAPSPKQLDDSLDSTSSAADAVAGMVLSHPDIPLPPGWSALREALHSLVPETRTVPSLRVDTTDTRALRRGLYAACACMYLPQVVGWTPPDAAVASSKPEVTHTAQDEGNGADPGAINATLSSALEPIMSLRVPSTFEVSVVTGGITNQLYRCSLSTHPGSPVLVRIYGPRTELVIDRSKENEVVDVLSATGQGPRIYGRFENGRMESWLSGSSITPAQMRAPHLSGLIAGALARLHVQDMPFPREPVISSVLHKWNKLASEVSFPDQPKKQKMLEELNFKQVIQATEEYLAALSASSFGSLNEDRLVFAHCDLLSGNIMHDSQDGHDSVALVDFEYSNFNPRGFDFANHFWSVPITDKCWNAAHVE